MLRILWVPRLPNLLLKAEGDLCVWVCPGLDADPALHAQCTVSMELTGRRGLP